MVIGQAVGQDNIILIEDAAKRAIARIVENNPDFRAAVQNEIAASAHPTIEEQREEAISNVYKRNYLLKDEVNWTCRQLLNIR
jgi:hypothetical protein